ncbi:MAG: pilus assembly protein [Elusimicrobia bacterium]|nr:pilus assembly protein [Elusimicrobiota bacterium]
MITKFKKTLRRFSSLIPHPSSLIPHPSSLIPHPSSLIPHPSSLIPHPSSFIPHPSSLKSRAGQAMTEVVLLFPMFMIIVFITVKIFALLVLVQKMEIASYYAARRWQLESHLNASYAASYDEPVLRRDIEDKVKGYLGFNSPSVSKFLNLRGLDLDIMRTQVWNVVTLTVTTNAAGVAMLCKYPKQVICATPFGSECLSGYDYICTGGKKLEVIKYVPNRDRPIQFVLPGLQ